MMRSRRQPCRRRLAEYARGLVLAFVLGLATVTGAHAVEPDEILKDAKLEARAREISQKLRCVVCQNQSIDDSSAPLAKDLRVLVRERLVAGDTDQQTIAFIVARYGNFVLLKPPVQFNTLLLWIGPLLLLVLAAIGFSRFLRRQSETPAAVTSAPLTAGEEARVRRLIEASVQDTTPPDRAARTGKAE